MGTLISKSDRRIEQQQRWLQDIAVRKKYRAMEQAEVRPYTMGQIADTLWAVYGIDAKFDECHVACEIGKRVLYLHGSFLDQLERLSIGSNFSFTYEFGQVRICRK